MTDTMSVTSDEELWEAQRLAGITILRLQVHNAVQQVPGIFYLCLNVDP